MNPEPPISLPEEYDTCILGRSVSPFEGRTRLVYSLSGILHKHDGDRDAVGVLMKEHFTEHTTDAPVFVDDEVQEQPAVVSTPTAKAEPVPAPMLFIDAANGTTDDGPKLIQPPPFTRVPVFEKGK